MFNKALMLSNARCTMLNKALKLSNATLSIPSNVLLWVNPRPATRNRLLWAMLNSRRCQANSNCISYFECKASGK